MAEGVETGRPAADRPSGLLGVASDYLALTKPPIISLLLITATGGMFLAAEGINRRLMIGGYCGPVRPV